MMRRDLPRSGFFSPTQTTPRDQRDSATLREQGGPRHIELLPGRGAEPRTAEVAEGDWPPPLPTARRAVMLVDLPPASSAAPSRTDDAPQSALTDAPTTPPPTAPAVAPPKAEKPQALTVAAPPRASDLGAADDVSDADLDRVVARLEALGRYAQLRHALEVGQLLVDTFFGSDVEAYLDRSSAKGRSFNALVARRSEALARLGLSAATLRGYIKVWNCWQQLPSAQRQGLQLSHFRQLAQLGDAASRQQLADQSRQQGWSVRELGRAVKAEQDSAVAARPVHGTRRRNAELRLRQAVQQAQALDRLEGVLSTTLPTWTPSQRTRFASEIDDAIAQLRRLQAKLKGDS